METAHNEAMRSELEKIAPGTALREGLDYIISASTGALIVIGDIAAIDPLCDGGFEIDTPYTPTRLYELAKMDGAIILDASKMRIHRANVHLQPDPSLPSLETGMRHRTAERASRQTGALVISVSQRRDVMSLYLAGDRVIVQDIKVLLAKADQALQTLQRYRARLDEVLDRLTILEFDDLVTMGDVAEVIGRFEMVRRVSREVSRYIVELGTEGRLVRMQAEELNATVDEQYALLVRDYAADPGSRKVAGRRGKIESLTLDQLLEPAEIANALGVADVVGAAEDHVQPRGFRVLSRIPMLPGTVVNRLVDRFETMPGLLRAGTDELDEVDGVGARRATAIADGLSRLGTHLLG